MKKNTLFRNSLIKTTISKPVLIPAILLTMILTLFAFTPIDAAYADSQVLYPEVTTPSTGNVFLGIHGSYEAVSTDAVLTELNRIRKEAYDEGLVTSYVPLKWSTDVERTAQIRAAEAIANEDHVRPKGGKVYPMLPSYLSAAENLAWGGNAMAAIKMWYDEKSDYVNNTGGVTGHYTNMINPSLTHVGIGSFKANGCWNSVAGVFIGTNASISESRNDISGSCIQLVEIPKTDVSITIDGADTLEVGRTVSLTATADYTKGYHHNSYYKPQMLMPGTNWKTSNASNATVTSAGTVTGVAEGAVTISAVLCNNGAETDLSASKDFTVTAPDLLLDDAIAKINAIPATVTLADADTVAAARTAYNKLTTAQKAEFPASTLAKLTKAEKTIAAWKQYEADAKKAQDIPMGSIKAKNTKGKKITVSWQITGGTGYEVWYSTDKKFSKGLKKTNIENPDTMKVTLKKLKKGKTYYVKVRTTSNILNEATDEWSKIPGKWSAVKKVKVKK